MTSNFHNFANVWGSPLNHLFWKGFPKKRFCQVPQHLEQQTTPPKTLHHLPPLLAGRFGKKTHLPTRAFIGFGGNVLVRAQHMPRFLIRRVPRHDEFWKIWQANQGRQRYERFVFFQKKLKQRLGKGCSSLFTNHLSKMIHGVILQKRKSKVFRNKIHPVKFPPDNFRQTSAPKILPTSPAAIKRMPAILGCPDHSSTVSKSMSFTFFWSTMLLQFHMFIHHPRVN